MQFCNYLINSFQFKRTLIFLFIFLIIKKPYSKKFWLRFLFEMMLQDLNHAVLQTLQKIIWKDIYVLQDDLVNKALPFAKLSPWVCWWIWIFLSFLRKFHVKDFIPIGTLWSGEKNGIFVLLNSSVNLDRNYKSGNLKIVFDFHCYFYLWFTFASFKKVYLKLGT